LEQFEEIPFRWPANIAVRIGFGRLAGLNRTITAFRIHNTAPKPSDIVVCEISCYAGWSSTYAFNGFPEADTLICFDTGYSRFASPGWHVSMGAKQSQSHRSDY
jgi:hypothetical protein